MTKAFKDFATHKRHAGVAQLAERNLAKVDVAGSNPVSRLLSRQTIGTKVSRLGGTFK